jgi:hypothetical protein
LEERLKTIRRTKRRELDARIEEQRRISERLEKKIGEARGSSSETE